MLKIDSSIKHELIIAQKFCTCQYKHEQKVCIFCAFVGMHKKGCVNLVILNNILSLLKERNKKQIDLMNYLGLSKNVFSEWKSGRATSYMKHLPEIAEFFGVSVDYLLGKTESNFTYALYNELAHDLSEDQIQQLKQFADFLRNSKK